MTRVPGSVVRWIVAALSFTNTRSWHIAKARRRHVVAEKISVPSGLQTFNRAKSASVTSYAGQEREYCTTLTEAVSTPLVTIKSCSVLTACR
jgi:hypothetical protein